MNASDPRRRHFMQRAGALAAMGLGARLNLIDLVSSAQAQTASDYRALVCVFLFGGNDGNNTIVPYDTAGYAQYAGVRSATSGIQLAQSSLLPIQPASSGTPFGLHPNLPELQSLFNSRKLAVLCNVGTLTKPTSKTQYVAGQVPLSLYSHSDQQAQWQSSISNVVS
ncbi:MAG TPA: Tat pathway signal protein, partial [Casimicrobiaceae bacterium]|nr:Tat pathway signal protein [Casimicrobiaceae bacterium]